MPEKKRKKKNRQSYFLPGARGGAADANDLGSGDGKPPCSRNSACAAGKDDERSWTRGRCG